jgi:uridine kinase
VDTADHVCLARRQVRDVRERGRAAEAVHKQYVEIVRPMAELYVYPSSRFADIIVSGEVPLEQSSAAVLARIKAAVAPRPLAPGMSPK